MLRRDARSYHRATRLAHGSHLLFKKRSNQSKRDNIHDLHSLPSVSFATLFRTSSPGWQHICENFYNTHLCNSHTQRAVSNFTEHRLEYHRGTEDRRTTLFGIGSATFDSMGRKSTCADSVPLACPRTPTAALWNLMFPARDPRSAINDHRRRRRSRQQPPRQQICSRRAHIQQ